MDDGFRYDRAPQWGPDAASVAASWGSLRDATAIVDQGGGLDSDAVALRPGPWSADDIRPLLRHADPKVRTLGVMLLYQLNRVDVLPDLAPLCFDPAATFPSCMISQIDDPTDPKSWSTEPRSVDFFAKRAIAAYAPAVSSDCFAMQGTGVAIRSVDELRAELVDFAARRNPTLCTPSLIVAMRRATSGTSPVPAYRLDRVDAVLGLLQRIPAPRRFFAALAVGFQEHAGQRYSADALLEMARQVPREMRLKAFRGEQVGDDPDLGRGDGFDYFVAHAAELFRASDADLFLKSADAELQDPERRQVADAVAAEYQVPAARLRPADADAILTQAMNRLGDRHDWSAEKARAKLALAMADIGGEASMRRAVDWIYTVRPEPGSYGGGREGVMGAVAADSPARARLLHERLIRDPRLDRLGPYSTRLLMQAVQGYLGRPLTSEDEILDAYYHDEAQRDGPFKPLAAWHDVLRKTVDEWSR